MARQKGAKRSQKPTKPGKAPRAAKSMPREEETIARIEALPPSRGALLMPIYLVASFWPWWLTFLVPVAIASQIWPRPWLTFAAFVLLGLTAGGWLAKKGLEALVRTSDV